MKTNLNGFVNSLSYIDILFIQKHIGTSVERKEVLEKILFHRENKTVSESFKYQNYNLDRKRVSRFKFYTENYFKEFSWDNLHAELKEIGIKFLSKDVSVLDKTMNQRLIKILLTDKKLTEETEIFSFHNCNIIRFILSALTKDLRHHNEFKQLGIAVDLENFYTPYFENHFKCEQFYTAIKNKYQTRRWEMLSEDIEEIFNHFNNKKQDILNKINLSGFITTYYQFHKNHEKQIKVINDLLEVITSNPYRNIKLNAFINNFFFNDYLFVDKPKIAMNYYNDLKKSNTEFKIGSPLYMLGVTLNLYDIQSARKFIPKSETNPKEIEEFMLPFVAKYYHLCKNQAAAEVYINLALKKTKKVNSIIYFVETFTVYFSILFEAEKYQSIINLYESTSFKIKYIKTQQIGDYNFEIRFYYLLSLLILKEISIPSFLNKILKLYHTISNETHIFTKLRMKKSIDTLIKLKIPINLSIEEKHSALYTEVKDIEELIVNQHKQ